MDRHDDIQAEDQKATTVSFSPLVLSRSPTFTRNGGLSVTPTVSTVIESHRADSRNSDVSDFSEVNVISGRGLCSKNPYYPKDLLPGVDENTMYGYPKYGYPDSSYPPEGIYPSSEFPPNRPGRHVRQIFRDGRFSKTAFHDLLEDEDDLTIFQSQPYPEIQGKFHDHYPTTNPSGFQHFTSNLGLNFSFNMEVDIADNESQDSDEEDDDLERPGINEEFEEANCPIGGEVVKSNPGPEEEDDRRKSKKFWKREKKSGGVSFDRNLPSTHSYLGSDMEEVQSGRTIHDDDSYVEIPIYLLPGIVLIPEQVIPLHLFQPQMVAMMKSVAEKDKTFGVMTFRNQFNEDRHELDVYGTTAEIFSMKDETDDISGISTLRIKARGRQRFQLIESHRDITGVLRAKVKIMPEKILPENLEGARPPSHAKLCCVPSGKGHRSGRTLSRLSCANYTWWPYWVYKMFDTEHLFEEIMKELRSWNDSLNEDSIPRTATELSFWLAQNLPLDDTIRLRLISYDSAIQRLRYELVVMKTCTVLQCKYCKTAIANKNDVFSMAVEGPVGAFVNPAGHVHETLTINQAKNLHLIGDFSTEHSWFPGYAWQIAQCKICGNHMGWKFKTEKKKKLSPPKFWGLCRSSLIPGMQSDDDHEKMHYMH